MSTQDQFEFYFPPRNYEGSYANTEAIRLSIFIITGVLVGFPALLWALRVLYCQHKSGGRLSFFSIFLLLSDLWELILGPVLVTNIFKECLTVCYVVQILLFEARLCGNLLHQLVALEYILIQKYPSLTVSPPCSITLCIIMWLIPVGCQFIKSNFIFEINLCLCVLPVMVCAVTCLVTCQAPPYTSQARDRKSEVLVLSVNIFTLLILYMPYFLSNLFYVPFNMDSLTSMRLISESILCALVCWQNHLGQTRLNV